MSIVNGWVDWAVKRPGPVDKVYSQPNSGLGWAFHSQEGWNAGSESRMFSTARLPNGNYTPYAAASWMFAGLRDGSVVQYYPVTASTWTSSSADWNTTLWSIEAEGTASMPLNEKQVASIRRLLREWEQHTGRVATRDQPGRTLWEHRENPAAQTACPSERYAPLYAALREENEMTPDERELLNHLADVVIRNGIDAEVTAGTKHLFPSGAPLDTVYTLRGDDALAYAKARGYSLALGLSNAQKSLGHLGGRLSATVERVYALETKGSPGGVSRDDIAGAFDVAAQEIRGETK